MTKRSVRPDRSDTLFLIVALLEEPDEGFDDRPLLRAFESFAREDHARGLVGHRQGVTVAAVARLELALEIGAPQIVGAGGLRQRRALGLVRPAPLAGLAHKAVLVEHGVDRRPGRNAHVAGQPAHQQFPDLARAPVRLVAPGLDDQPLDLVGQLVGVSDRSPRAIAKRFKTLLLVAVEDLVAGLAGNPELPAHIAHAFSFQKAGHET